MRKFFAVAALFTCSQLLAQQKDSVNNIDGDLYSVNALDNVIITTNKSPKKQSQTGKVITVINHETLERMGGRTVGEILNTVAGTTINGANNALGTNLRISIRGSSDGNVLLLIDGIPVNDPSVITNYFDLNFINSLQIERIEVLKGGQSTLYGSDAVSGVINIITKKVQTKKLLPYASVNFGSYNTFTGSAGVKGQTKTIGYNAFAAGISSAGFSSAYDSTGGGNYDKDGYKQYIFHGDLNINLSQKLRWDLLASFSHYKADIDAAAFKDDADFITKNKNWQVGTGLYWKQQNGSLHFNYQFNYVNRFYLDDSLYRSSFFYFSKSNYTGKTNFAELYESYKKNRIELLAGIDYRFYKTSQVYESVSSFGPSLTELGDSLARMWLLSPYASIVYNHNDLNIELGGRWNHHNVYGNNFTYTFNPSYLIKKKIKAFANVSSAFKTPSLYQLFDPYSGSRQLGPERSTVYEAGVELYAAGNLKLRLTGFYGNTKNAIQYIITDPVNFSGHYQNISNQKNYGAELEFNYEKGHWNISANYTYTRGSTRSAYSESGDLLAKDTSYNNLYRVPEHAFNSFVSYSLKKITLSTLLKYTGNRLEPVYASAPNELDDYLTIDLSGQYHFNKMLRMFLDLKNITNEKYFDVFGYNSRRFNFTIGIGVAL